LSDAIDQDFARRRRTVAEALGFNFNIQGRVHRPKACRESLCFRGADIFIRKLNLPLEVRPLDPVVVPEFDPADTGCSQVKRTGPAESPGPDDGNMGSAQLLHARPANFLQEDMAAVAIQLLRRQAHAFASRIAVEEDLSSGPFR
jgi:hypothetical protein